MFPVWEIGKVAAILYAVDTVVKTSTGEQQERTPESFTPDAIKVLNEANRAVGTGVAKYLEESGQDKAPETTSTAED